MNFSRNLCFFCLSNDQKLTWGCDLSPNVLETMKYIIPEYDFQNSDIPIQICDNCVNRSEDICNFRLKCLQSIHIHKKYVQKLKQEDESSGNVSITITEILNDEACDITEDIQNVINIKAEPNFEEDIKSELSVTHYNSRTDDDEKIIDQMTGKFEVIEIEEKDDVYISSNDSNEFVSQSTHHDTDSTNGRESIETDERPYICDICQRSFKEKTKIRRHYSVHSDVKPYSCEICHKSFKYSFTMKKHKYIHSSKHTCELCHKSFTNIYDLKEHNLVHSGEMPYSCSVCDKKFSVASNLRRHQTIHRTDEPYKCDVCPKSFGHSSGLNRHKLIHSGKKTHTCEICHKSFIHLFDLRDHSRTHSAEKPFDCSVCQKKFALLKYLKRHEVIHTNVKSYSCDFCHKSFRHLSNMKRHELAHVREIPNKC